jgi:hypothetical protein
MLGGTDQFVEVLPVPVYRSLKTSGKRVRGLPADPYKTFSAACLLVSCPFMV